MSPFGTTSSIPIDVEIPGYRLRRQVGSDSVGLFFDAEQESLRRKVTVKVLKPEYERHDRAREKFLSEMDLLSPLAHPNIARVLDSSRSGTLSLVTERSFLWTLHLLLELRRPLGEQLSLKHARSIATGLRYLVTQGLAYRNLTPRAVSVSEDTCRLATFSYVVTAAELESHKGKLVQDVHYVAPEQLAGEAQIGPSTPCYQVGALLFHMLSGRPPHSARLPMEVARSHLTKPFPSLKRMQPFLSDGVYDLISACTQPHPAKRPELVDVIGTIDRLLRDGPSGAPRLRRRRRR